MPRKHTAHDSSSLQGVTPCPPRTDSAAGRRQSPQPLMSERFAPHATLHAATPLRFVAQAAVAPGAAMQSFRSTCARVIGARKAVVC